MAFAISLAGGGIRGAAHVGVLKALEEEGLYPDAISGTSAGSIVAGLYAAGMSVSELEDLVMHLMKYGHRYLDVDYFGLIRFLTQLLFHQPSCFTGFIKGNRLLELFYSLTDGMKITDAKMKLVIPSVDLHSGSTIAFTNACNPQPVSSVRWEQEVLISEAMIASSSIPAVFRPRRWNKDLLVDGGVTNNLPVNLLYAANTTNIIGVNISESYRSFENCSIFEVITHSFSIMSDALMDCISTKEIFSLNPPLPANANLFSFDAMQACMTAGYDYTKKMMPRIRKTLPSDLSRIASL